jgi:hypothetical protein
MNTKISADKIDYVDEYDTIKYGTLNTSTTIENCAYCLDQALHCCYNYLCSGCGARLLDRVNEFKNKEV